MATRWGALNPVLTAANSNGVAAETQTQTSRQGQDQTSSTGIFVFRHLSCPRRMQTIAVPATIENGHPAGFASMGDNAPDMALMSPETDGGCTPSCPHGHQGPSV